MMRPAQLPDPRFWQVRSRKFFIVDYYIYFIGANGLCNFLDVIF
jgi:hypothetical protein